MNQKPLIQSQISCRTGNLTNKATSCFIACTNKFHFHPREKTEALCCVIYLESWVFNYSFLVCCLFFLYLKVSVYICTMFWRTNQNISLNICLFLWLSCPFINFSFFLQWIELQSWSRKFPSQKQRGN